MRDYRSVWTNASSLLVSTAALLLLLPASALAVPYSFPDDGDYYQLQRLDDYRTVCETGGEVCDVPAGEYTLLNLSIPNGEEGHRTVITVIGENGETQDKLVEYENIVCVEPDRLGPIDKPSCTAQCSAGQLTGGACVATYTTASTGEPDIDEFPLQTFDRLSQDGYTCTVANGQFLQPPPPVQGFEFPEARLTLSIACIQ